MSKMNPNKKKETSLNDEQQRNEDATNLQEEQTNAAEETDASDNVSDELETLKKKYNELNDSHLRLMAEFDNYRKRTLREKSELIKNGGEKALVELLPVIDDFERALQNIQASDDVKAIIEGVELIYNKFMSYLSQQGVKAIEAVGKPFDTEMFEAIATIPAPEPEMKGKVLDCVQTGYTLNDKVIRHAKVVVGE
ncbi:nucleotide exchange factor GrpE [Parabacteroides bouchesdurhonensis]|uniref:nucleotide exchange factor GrpE n=1 Tax=Parabacteroides bouchesdurhonensis TaxID=1936995 RepID=UPI000C846A8C|nr:nucleotide exchange factor GrpE [Parabacteroides bouchesdurhonensis]RHJ90623.1 nucleotide exchange factor GrpE [Bacteroides sp. AM07-16]